MPLIVCPTCDRLISDAEHGCLECGETPDSSDAGLRETPDASKDEGLNEIEAAPAGGVGRREVLMVAGALLASAAITLTLLSARGKVPTAVPVPRTVAASGFAGASAETVVPSGGARWTPNSEAWVGADRKGTALELPARNETKVWMRTVRPLLVVRCVNHRTDVFVFTDSAAAMEKQDEDHSVKVALDGEPERTERWPDSASHDALFAPDGPGFLQQLGRARILRFSYTPHNAAPVVALFDVAGLAERLPPVAARCSGGK